MTPASNTWLPGPTRLCIPNCISISIQHSSRQGVHILDNGPPFSSQNCHFAPGAGGSGPHLIHGSLDHQSPHHKQHLNQFSFFCMTHNCERQTDRQTDTICYKRLHLASATMRINNCGQMTGIKSGCVKWPSLACLLTIISTKAYSAGKIVYVKQNCKTMPVFATTERVKQWVTISTMHYS